MIFANPGAHSVIGSNLQHCLQRFSCTVNDFLSNDINRIFMEHHYASVTDDVRRAAGFLTELVYDRDYYRKRPGILSRDEINNIIDFICTQ